MLTTGIKWISPHCHYICKAFAIRPKWPRKSQKREKKCSRFTLIYKAKAILQITHYNFFFLVSFFYERKTFQQLQRFFSQRTYNYFSENEHYCILPGQKMWLERGGGWSWLWFVCLQTIHLQKQNSVLFHLGQNNCKFCFKALLKMI